MEEVFIGVMDLQEAKTHQIKMKHQGVELNLKSNGETCTTGCKVTVELWAYEADLVKLQNYFRADFSKHVKGHEPNLEHMGSVFDSTASEVICQACGTKFSPASNECPDCGLVY